MTLKQKLSALWGLGLFLLVGAFGAITALGNTLFPSRSLSEGLANDFSSSAPFLIHLRIYHPILAITLGISWFLISTLYSKEEESGEAKWSQAIQALVVASLGFGVLNYLLMAPVWSALIHLTLADIFWLICVGYLCRIHYKVQK